MNNIKNLVKLINIESLVIGGGGMNGLIFVGALKYLEEINILKNIKYYHGVSIGAILVSLLNLGWSIDEIIEITNFPFDKLLSYDIDYFLNNSSFMNKEDYLTLLQKIITYKNFDKNLSFLDLYNFSKKELNIYSFGLNDNKLHIFNHINTPTLPIFEALYMSSCIPFLLSPLNKFNNHFIDGAFSCSFPMKYVKNIQKSIGIYSAPKHFNYNFDNHDILDYLINISYVITNNIHNINIPNTIYVKYTSHILSYINFSMSIKEKKNMINAGYSQSINQIHTIIDYFLNNITSDNSIYKHKYYEI
jgi:predicted patatin/cPLA2 family phospholipase